MLGFGLDLGLDLGLGDVGGAVDVVGVAGCNGGGGDGRINQIQFIYEVIFGGVE